MPTAPSSPTAPSPPAPPPTRSSSPSVATSAGNVWVLLGNGADNIIGPAYIVDHTAPSVISINRTNPAGSNANGASVAYTVTFSEAVTGVDAGDFQLILTGTVTTTPPL